MSAAAIVPHRCLDHVSLSEEHETNEFRGNCPILSPTFLKYFGLFINAGFRIGAKPLIWDPLTNSLHAPKTKTGMIRWYISIGLSLSFITIGFTLAKFIWVMNR